MLTHGLPIFLIFDKFLSMGGCFGVSSWRLEASWARLGPFCGVLGASSDGPGGVLGVSRGGSRGVPGGLETFRATKLPVIEVL